MFWTPCLLKTMNYQNKCFFQLINPVLYLLSTRDVLNKCRRLIILIILTTLSLSSTSLQSFSTSHHFLIIYTGIDVFYHLLDPFVFCRVIAFHTQFTLQVVICAHSELAPNTRQTFKLLINCLGSTKQYFHVVLFIMLNKVALQTVESVDENLVCGHSDESHGTVLYVVLFIMLCTVILTFKVRTTGKKASFC